MLKELQRRNVHRVAIGYLAGAWLVVQVVETLTPTFFSETLFRAVVILLMIGFVPALILAWKFEWTPEGLQREADVSATTPRSDSRLYDRLITVTLVLAVGYFAVDKFALDPVRDEALQTQAEESGRAAALIESYGDKSIAVLPFVDMSPEGDQEYFSDGIAEEVLNLLAKARDLRVISRSSAFRYRGNDIHIPTVAEELNVGYVLEGSVRKAGNSLRITAQLIDARADAHVWSETYDRRLEDIFAIQEEISKRIFSQLNATILGESPMGPRTDTETYTLYLQARHIANSLSDFLTVEELLKEALDRDPDYVAALNLMASAIFFLTGEENEYPPEEGIARMRSYVDRVLAIDPGNAIANGHRGWMASFYNNDPKTAVAYIQRALETDPQSELVLQYAGVVSRSIGRNEDAIEFAEAALERDPLCSICLYALMYATMRTGDYETALEASGRRMRLSAGGWITRGYIHLLMDDPHKALEAFEKQPEDRIGPLSGRAIAYHELGDLAARDAALKELGAFDERRALKGVATVHAWTGNTDDAFVWLGRYLDPQAPTFGKDAPNIIWDPMFRNLHADPRWRELRRQVGLDPDSLAGIYVQMPSR
jgi:TolB-like protein